MRIAVVHIPQLLNVVHYSSNSYINTVLYVQYSIKHSGKRIDSQFAAAIWGLCSPGCSKCTSAFGGINTRLKPENQLLAIFIQVKVGTSACNLCIEYHVEA